MSFSFIKNKMMDPNVSHSFILQDTFGIATDEGETVLADDDIESCCGTHNMMSPDEAKKFMGGVPLDMGTDWGSGEVRTDRQSGLKSFTAVAIGGWHLGKFVILYIERYRGEKANLEVSPRYINSTARAYGIGFAANDYGFGAYANASLCADYGWKRHTMTQTHRDPILHEVELTNQSASARYDEGASHGGGRYRLDRNQAIERTIHAIKTQQILLPKKSIMYTKPTVEHNFASDFTTIYREYDEKGHKYRYDHTLPDDVFHAIMLCYFMGLHRNGQMMPGFLALNEHDRRRYTPG
jgi:hypothetical protein